MGGTGPTPAPPTRRRYSGSAPRTGPYLARAEPDPRAGALPAIRGNAGSLASIPAGRGTRFASLSGLPKLGFPSGLYQRGRPNRCPFPARPGFDPVRFSSP
jgi:hypothetical protein